MRALTILSTLMAAVAAFSLASCGKGVPGIPAEVSGLTDVLKGATSSLSGIASADPAEAVDKAKEALPDLTSAGESMTKVSGLMGSLPGPAKAAVTKALEAFGPKLEQLIGTVSKIPGVGGAIGPALETITAQLTALKG